ncbi:MAG: dienelactone hydrolase family protein [Cyanobacteriota bacterium]
MSVAAIPSLPAPETLRTAWVSIPVAAAVGVAPTTIRAWWSRPASGPLRGAVLVLPEVFGVNGWVRSVADRLAAQGYGALAITPFARTAPELDLGYDDAGLAIGREHRDQVQASSFLADAQAAVHWLQQVLQVEGLADQPLGCVGFCFGGHLASLAATLPAIGATCSFYGARISTFRPGGGPPTLEVLPEIPGRLWCFVGDADPLMPEEEVAAIRAAMERANGGRSPDQPEARHRFWCAPQAGHGYLCEARTDFHPVQAAIAWTAMLQLLEEQLGGF